MKKLFSLAMMLTLCATISFAQKNNANLKTTVFNTDIVCKNCEKKIMNNVPALGKGVEDVKVNVETKEVTVVYDATKTSEEQLVKGFAKISVKAEPKAAAACNQSKKTCDQSKKACCKENKGQPACDQSKKTCDQSKKACCKENKGQPACDQSKKACCKENKQQLACDQSKKSCDQSKKTCDQSKKACCKEKSAK